MSIDAHIQVVHNHPAFLTRALLICDHISIEFLLKLKVFGWRFYWPSSVNKRWNFLDASLVLSTGVLVTWIVPLFAWTFGLSLDAESIKILNVLRTARLARMVRVAQRVHAFKEAWMLIRGLSDSVRTLFWTCVVVCFVTYIFAIFGLLAIIMPLQERYNELLSQQATDEDSLETVLKLEEVLEISTGMDQLMYTLIQILMGDSYHSFTRTIMKHLQWSWLYFYSYIAVAVLVLMNLVTAIIVDNALSTSRMDEESQVKQKEMAKDRDIRELKKLFDTMDADGSGTLSWDEFKDSFDDPEMSKKWVLLDFQPGECRELFSLLDDGDGEIATEEFFDGLRRMKGLAQSKDIFRMQKCIVHVAGMLEEVKDQVNTLKHLRPQVFTKRAVPISPSSGSSFASTLHHQLLGNSPGPDPPEPGEEPPAALPEQL
eukprot:CAMPEP_0206422920 /NCGR_PEP_ID=MMETSP0324_2-20121206/2380_1 /ASSEMBLY_ACC=CAM_ASM_000836 /TAXON_ID=2866 /ORGANISM="Crypthecodinium cohnii, Strain Seligo" /LENGTH=428 /DNA_ID=CAMNT_0053887397 /DNA_START=137 /DNA_END=1423 /DNA_ORIENTATION=-